MDSKSLGRSMRLSVAEGALATAMAALFSGVFLTGFAMALGATSVQIGLLMTLPAICGVAQLASSYWIERRGQCRSFCLWTTGAARAMYVPVLVIALFAHGSSAQTKVWWIVAAMALSGMLGSMGGGAWLSWIGSLVPGGIRIGFLGRRNLVNSGLSFVLCFAGGAVIDRWSGGEGRIGGYAAVFAAAMICGLLSSILLARIPAGTAHPLAPRKAPLLKMLAEPLEETNFRRLMFFYTAWNLAANMSIPFFAVFYIKDLGLTLRYIVVLTTLTSLTGLAANNFWTRLAERYGLKLVVLIATLGDALYPLALVFIRPSTAWVLVIVHCYGFFNAPITFAPDSFVLKLAPEGNNSYFISVFKSVVGIAATVAAITGGWLAETSTLGSAGGGTAFAGGLKMVFIISFVGRVASLALLAAVAEPGAVSLRQVAIAVVPGWARGRPAGEPSAAQRAA